MPRNSFAAVALLATAVFACSTRHAVVGSPGAEGRESRAISPAPGETHLHNIRQLTYGGENAEAYFSPDGRWLIFQSTRDGRSCDQQYIMRSADGSVLRRVSGGTGKTTCGYFIDGGKRILYASTDAA